MDKLAKIFYALTLPLIFCACQFIPKDISHDYRYNSIIGQTYNLRNKEIATPVMISNEYLLKTPIDLGHYHLANPSLNSRCMECKANFSFHKMYHAHTKDEADSNCFTLEQGTQLTINRAITDRFSDTVVLSGRIDGKTFNISIPSSHLWDIVMVQQNTN